MEKKAIWAVLATCFALVTLAPVLGVLGVLIASATGVLIYEVLTTK